jgi:hypothetical protein
MWIFLLITIVIARAQDEFDYMPKINTNLTLIDTTKCLQVRLMWFFFCCTSTNQILMIFQPKNNTKIHKLNQIVLKKCCPVGYHFDSDNDGNETRAISYCQKSVNTSLSISIIHITSKSNKLTYYEAIELSNQPKVEVGSTFAE